MNILTKVIKKIQEEGLKKTFLGVVTNSYDRIYDYRYGIDTYSWVSKEELVLEDEVGKNASSYQATRVLPLRVLLKKLNISKNDVIIDIGSGKGRVLLVASEFGFKEARGIEFSANLCRIANDNIKIYQQKKKPKTKFEIIKIDASKYQFKDDESVFFMYNPFDYMILNKVLQNISESLQRRPRDIQIIYAYPVNRQYIEAFMNIKSVETLKIFEGDFIVYRI